MSSTTLTSLKFDIAMFTWAGAFHLGRRFMPHEAPYKAYASTLSVGIQSFLAASLADRVLRALFLNKDSKNFLENRIKNSPSFVQVVVAASIEEGIYTLILSSQSTHWLRTIARVVLSCFTAMTATRGLYGITESKNEQGLLVDGAIGLIWAMCRESIVRLLPTQVSRPLCAGADSIIFSLSEVCPIKGVPPYPRFSRVWFYKVISSIAFRSIAQVSDFRGDLASPFLQHIFFNISHMLPE